MKFGWVIGVVLAVLFHAAFLCFGGLIVGTRKEEKGVIHIVDLVPEEAVDEKKDKPKEDEKKPEDPIETQEEDVPDAEQVARDLEISAAAQAPALEAASLAEIEQALSGQKGGGFGESISFASGGKIGGTAKAGSLEEKIEDAFSLSEIDQKPKATFRAPPTYPAEMRGKKVEGTVSVIFVVDATGKVTNPKVEKSSHPAFERAALEAVRQWRFDPGVEGRRTRELQDARADPFPEELNP